MGGMASGSQEKLAFIDGAEWPAVWVGWSSLFFGGLRAARSHWLRRRRESEDKQPTQSTFIYSLLINY